MTGLAGCVTAHGSEALWTVRQGTQTLAQCVEFGHYVIV